MTRVLRKIKWMVINILFPEFMLSKGICDLRLALEQLREFDEYLQGTLTWTTSWIAWNRTKHIQKWQWVVKYPQHSKLLYWLLGLKQPNFPDPKIQEDIERNPSSPSSPSPCGSLRPPHSDSMALQDLAASERNMEAAEPHIAHPDSQEADEGAASMLSQSHVPSKAEHLSISEHDSQAPQKDDQYATETNIPSSSYGQPEGIGIAQDCIKAAPEPAKASGMDVTGDSNVTARRSQESKSQVMGSVKYTEEPQQWTAVHSYYAQMGGLLYWILDFDTKKSGNCALTASKLTSRYIWARTEVDFHPLKGVHLSEQDINDKSKADWLLKGIAILQIIWLILNITVRGITGLPITQLEIATIAFAVIAIFTYLANWWKPKDVSQPTTLQTRSLGWSEASDQSQQLSLRMWSPSKAAERSKHIHNVTRVPNDSVWMEGDTPLIFILMAVSSLAFGGLHCLAWNFEFPTRAELICWRAASLTSAILPVIVVGSSLALNYMLTFLDRHPVSSPAFVAILEPLFRLPEEWWHPKYIVWSPDAQRALLSMPSGSRKWDQEPSAYDVETTKQAASLQFPDGFKEPSLMRMMRLMDFHRILGGVLRGANRQLFTGPHPDMLPVALSLKFYAENVAGPNFYPLKDDPRDECHGWFVFYDRFIMKKYAIPATDLRHDTIIGLLISAGNEARKYLSRRERLHERITLLSTILAIVGGITYALARVAIIILVFTCLRATPEGVYQNTPWTRFLPNIS
ncbi:hypothetical protein N0V82_009011 [Gnomoniopsis sp. IMI 355080]|nr:hypothetical protein N0V82_009011 [Gnomoniopsis sp. IMI 355080]